MRHLTATPEGIRWLLEQGAAVGTRENLGRTALMFASTGPFHETVQLLLERGANPHDADEFEGWTSLMFAAGRAQLEVVRVLLKTAPTHLSQTKTVMSLRTTPPEIITRRLRSCCGMR